MNCRDFDQVWNQLLDAESQLRRRLDANDQTAHAVRLDREQRLREHAEACASCQMRQHQFETLRQVMRAWTARPQAGPTVSPRLADQILEAVSQPKPTPELELIPAGRRRSPGVALGLMLAAAVVAAVLIVTPKLTQRIGRPTRDPDALKLATATAPRPVAKSGMLKVAVVDARAASWHLAELASEPAARLGREMIDASFRPSEEAPPEFAVLTPSRLPEVDLESFSPDLLNQMSDYLSAGVRPLSSTARQAFGFLRSPTLEKSERRAVQPAAKGA